jgi:competence protein ComFC
MNFIQKTKIVLFRIFFPSPYKNKKITTIPRAPENNNPGIFSLFDYHHYQGKELIYYIKKYQDPYLQRKIAEHMYEQLLEYISEQQLFGYFINPIITTVPLTIESRQKRNFNQCNNIAKFLSEKYQGSYKNIFIKTKQTKKQALLLSKNQRKQNIKNSFAVKKTSSLDQKDVIIIDDLITTGATLEELFHVSRKCKVRNIIAITIAH